MMIEKFLNDQQRPKTVEKIYSRLVDLLSQNEEIIYIATQKIPLVDIMADCIAITNKRILFFTPSNLRLSVKFIDFVWKDIVDVYTREEIIGAVFSVKTVNGNEMIVDNLPKIQARKLYQYAQERKEEERELRRQRDLEEKRAASGSTQIDNPANVVFQNHTPTAQPATPLVLTSTPPPIIVQEEPVKDELTEKLKKLKTLFDNGLISQEDYNHKKQELLSQL